MLLAVFLSPLVSRWAAWLPACPFRSLTGYPCPGCGTTRAALLLAGLEPLEALARYPLPALLWILFVVGGTVAGLGALLRWPLGSLGRRLRGDWPPWLRWSLVAALVANWLHALGTGV